MIWILWALNWLLGVIRQLKLFKALNCFAWRCACNLHKLIPSIAFADEWKHCIRKEGVQEIVALNVVVIDSFALKIRTAIFEGCNGCVKASAMCTYGRLSSQFEEFLKEMQQSGGCSLAPLHNIVATTYATWVLHLSRAEHIGCTVENHYVNNDFILMMDGARHQYSSKYCRSSVYCSEIRCRTSPAFWGYYRTWFSPFVLDRKS